MWWIFWNHHTKIVQVVYRRKNWGWDFHYIGSQMVQRADGIRLDHSRYMANLGHIHLEPDRTLQKTDQLSMVEQKLYCKLIGQLNWAVQGSQPALTFELVDMSTKLNKAPVADLVHAVIFWVVGEKCVWLQNKERIDTHNNTVMML